MSKIFVIVGILGLLACQEDQAVTTDVDLIDAANLDSSEILSLRITPQNPSIDAGRLVSFSAYATLIYDREIDVTAFARWQSADQDVLLFPESSVPDGATLGGQDVGEPLIAQTLKEGSVEIQVEYQGHLANTLAQIGDKKLDSIVISPETIPVNLPIVNDLVIPTRVDYEVIGIYSDGTTGKIETGVEMVIEDAALVMTDGVLMAHKPGDYILKAMFEGFETEATVKVSQAEKVITAITVKPTSIVVPIGGAEPLQATALFSDGTSSDVSSVVKLEGGDDTLLQVTRHPLRIDFKGLTKGTTIYNFNLEGVTRRVSARVIDPASVSLEVESNLNFKLAKGRKEQLKVFAELTDGARENITSRASYKSSNTAIAVFSQDEHSKGEIEGRAVGDVEMTIEWGGLEVKQVYQIEAAAIEALILTNPGSDQMPVGVVRDFQAVATYSDATVANIAADVNWTLTAMTGNAVLSNSPKGQLTASAAGTVQISFSYQGFTDQRTITVVAAEPVGVTIVAGTNPMSAGTNQSLVAQVLYTDGTVVNRTDEATWTYDIVSEGLSYGGYVRDDAGFKGQCHAVQTGDFKAIASYGGFKGELLISVVP